ncbi:hypothetical protein RFF05_12320 [Bengtsoniella intestinalis]|uniref:hypothetical protein n=1 Tax=Bengtsoniella intestinalis TaxID=3073143 RepID=UPI00391F8AF1
METPMEEIRHLSRTAKICDDEELAESLDRDIAEAFQSPGIQDYENFVEGIEYLSGIRHGTPPAQVQALFGKIRPTFLTPHTLDAAYNATPNPALLNIQYPDVQHMVDNSIAAAPQNWNCHSNDTHTPLRERDLQPGNDMDEMVSNFAVGATKRHLGVLFAPIENEEKPQLGRVSRASLITIGGKSLRELITEEGHRQGKLSKTELEQFFTENAEQLSTEYVAAGVLSASSPIKTENCLHSPM